jgi:hypothetical protein
LHAVLITTSQCKHIYTYIYIRYSLIPCSTQNKPTPGNRMSPVVNVDESLFAGNGALSVSALQDAREEIDKKLRGIRKMIEENLREELELQVSYHYHFFTASCCFLTCFVLGFVADDCHAKLRRTNPSYAGPFKMTFSLLLMSTHAHSRFVHYDIYTLSLFSLSICI